MPEQSRILNAPLPAGAGGWGQITENGWTGRNDPGYRKMKEFVEASLVPLATSEAVSPSDTVIFRYVVCADSTEQVDEELRRLVYRRDEGDPRVVFLLADPEEKKPPAAAPSPGEAFCAEFEDRIPPATLPEGDFGFALLRVAPQEALDRAGVEKALAAGAGPSLLGTTSFSVTVPRGDSEGTGQR